jgi:alpha-soluble NSF attachment protein
MSVSEADTLVAKAEKVLSPKWYVKIFSSIDYDKAIDLLKKAQILYLREKKYDDAIATLDRITDIHVGVGDTNFGLIASAEAFKIATTRNVGHLESRAEKLVKLYDDHGEFYKASNTAYETACKFSKDGDYQIAEKFGYLARKYAEMISQPNLDMRICEELGRISFYLEKYERAFEELESCAKKMINENISKYGAKDRFFDALLVHIMTHGDDVDASRRVFTSFMDFDPMFDQYEKFFVDIFEHIESGDVDEFSKTVFKFNQVNTLNQFRTSALLKIKNNIGKVDLT